jgi:methionyl aminopeptidase
LQELLEVTRKAQWEAMMAARAGMPTNIIGKTITEIARRHDFRVIANLTGHGIGRSIHEPPEILNTYNKRDIRPLREGLVITIEPFLTIGDREIVESKDGWTLRSAKGSLGAQFEHTFIVQRGEPIVLTLSG